jgi:hypothetical protein
MIVELSLAVGRSPAELRELDDADLATMLDVLEERRRG